MTPLPGCTRVPVKKMPDHLDRGQVEVHIAPDVLNVCTHTRSAVHGGSQISQGQGGRDSDPPHPRDTGASAGKLHGSTTG